MIEMKGCLDFPGLQKLTAKDFRFVDLPKPAQLSDYEKVTTKFVHELSSLDDVTAMYQAGSVSCPGISDLDFIVVLKDKLKKPQECIAKIKAIVKRENRFLIHYPHIIPESVFPKIHYLIPIFNIIKLWGKSYTIEKPKEQKALLLATIVDLININWPQSFLKYLIIKKIKINQPIANYVANELLRAGRISWLSSKREIPVRTLLCRINAMKYTIQLIDAIKGKKSNRWEKYVDTISELRKNWFELGDEKYDTLVDCLKETIELCLWIIHQTRDLIDSACPFLSYKSLHGLVMAKDHAVVYTPDWQADKSLKLALEAYAKTGELLSVLPSELLLQRRILEQVFGQKTASSYFSAKEIYPDIIKNRYCLFFKQINFLNTHSFPFKPAIHYPDYLVTKPTLYKAFMLFNKRLRKKKIEQFLKSAIHKTKNRLTDLRRRNFINHSF